MSQDNETYSVVLRVQRITYEDAYVSVPLTSDVTKENDDGSVEIDFELFSAEAIRISKDKKVEWQVESCETAPHPMQQPKPEARFQFDGYHQGEKEH